LTNSSKTIITLSATPVVVAHTGRNFKPVDVVVAHTGRNFKPVDVVVAHTGRNFKPVDVVVIVRIGINSDANS